MPISSDAPTNVLPTPVLSPKEGHCALLAGERGMASVFLVQGENVALGDDEAWHRRVAGCTRELV